MSKELEDYRMGHLVRTAEVWKQLSELGATEESKLDFYFQFSTKRKDAVEALKSKLAGYPLAVSSEGISRETFTISGNIRWSEEQLIKWVDYLFALGMKLAVTLKGAVQVLHSSNLTSKVSIALRGGYANERRCLGLRQERQ